MSEAFESIMAGLNDALAYERGENHRAFVRVRESDVVVHSIQSYNKESIKRVRLNLRLSQKAFSEVLGVSVKTVEAWEAGVNTPSGSSSRMIELVEKDGTLLEHYHVISRGE